MFAFIQTGGRTLCVACGAWAAIVLRTGSSNSYMSMNVLMCLGIGGSSGLTMDFTHYFIYQVDICAVVHTHDNGMLCAYTW